METPLTIATALNAEFHSEYRAGGNSASDESIAEFITAQLKSVTAERDALRKALEVAVNTVECDSTYLLTDGVTREELPWYKGARAALAPRQPKERK